MKLQKARIQNYRSIRDSGWFDVELEKTILVGPNEAGKTVLLRALEKINPPDGNPGFEPIRDFPRSELHNLKLGMEDDNPLSASDVTVAEAQFLLEKSDRDAIAEIDKHFANATTYVFGRRLDNGFWHKIIESPPIPTYGEIRKTTSLIVAHADSLQMEHNHDEQISLFTDDLIQASSAWTDATPITGDKAQSLALLLRKIVLFLNKHNLPETPDIDDLAYSILTFRREQDALDTLKKRLPVFVYFSNYFRVHPRIHLAQLADRIDAGALDQDPYDRGNHCLLKLLGFDARELSRMGQVSEPSPGNEQETRKYQNQLDRRAYLLKDASTKLTASINEVWKPNPTHSEYDRLRITADQQYLKVVVEDDLEAEVELDQRSEGFQWLVSFFVVFFAEAKESHKNAILLLDEPGLSLHGLKQKEFRSTISRLAKTNQLLYSTHSPFMVGSDELDFVRVVEMTDRSKGTVVHTTITASDSTALLPLQEALGYDLAQNLFIQNRNLILEGLTDYWYIEAVASLLREANIANLNTRISLIPASSAGKVVYFATILHANNLKVAALLDSDAAGDDAANVDVLAHILKNDGIIRTKDAYVGPVKNPGIEEMLRDTLVNVAKTDLEWDITAAAKRYPKKLITNILADKAKNQSHPKYSLAKAFLRWAREHSADDLTETECCQWKTLIGKINRALK